jgi:hypothetical protein
MIHLTPLSVSLAIKGLQFFGRKFRWDKTDAGLMIKKIAESWNDDAFQNSNFASKIAEGRI